MPEKVKVLVVDDSAYMRVVLKDMLESDGSISVIGVAKDSLEAIEKVKTLAPDVVLLDIQMPKMDGIATLQRIMKESPTRTDRKSVV
jgi:two-component system chemotaxis response regulator CheB